MPYGKFLPASLNLALLLPAEPTAKQGQAKHGRFDGAEGEGGGGENVIMAE